MPIKPKLPMPPLVAAIFDAEAYKTFSRRNSRKPSRGVPSPGASLSLPTSDRICLREKLKQLLHLLEHLHNERGGWLAACLS